MEGLGIGPLFVGPLSEVYGRNPIYRASFGLVFAFSWGVAFAPNIGMPFAKRFESFLIICHSCLLDIPLPDGPIWSCIPQCSRRHRKRLVSTQQSSQVRTSHRQVLSILIALQSDGRVHSVTVHRPGAWPSNWRVSVPSVLGVMPVLLMSSIASSIRIYTGAGHTGLFLSGCSFNA